MNLSMIVLSILLVITLSLGVFSFTDNSIIHEEKPASLLIGKERFSPSDWVKENQIKVYQNKVILDINDASWATFTDTNSMDPFLDKDTNAIEVLPKDPDSVKIGDIISYNSPYGVIIHRVVEKGMDEHGQYFVVKGDNNTLSDPVKVRFNDLKGVVVAVIY